MKKLISIYLLSLLLIGFSSCDAKNRADQPEKNKVQIRSESASSIPLTAKINTIFAKNAPNSITRSIIQDQKGNIWLATWEGILKYDGQSFTNITNEVSLSRFFSILEDRNGNFWFGSIGDGAYFYDGKSFQHFTTEEGLINNEIVCIYEDKVGNIWFGANGGMSCYNGEFFRNFGIKGDTILEAEKGVATPNLQRPIEEVNAIVEDETGKFWFATRGNTFVYDGKKFTTLTQDGQPFINVRSIIEDKVGHIWLGGNGGFWRYKDSTFTKFTRDFVGYIHEDKKGHIWTSSESSKTFGWALTHYDANYLNKTNNLNWALTRYDVMPLNSEKKSVTEIKTGEGMFFGILEDADGNIWTGTLNGVCRYDGRTFSYFKG